jgi:hypothetical protein
VFEFFRTQAFLPSSSAGYPLPAASAVFLMFARFFGNAGHPAEETPDLHLVDSGRQSTESQTARKS